MAGSIHDIISATPTGGTAVLPAGEFEGPVSVGRAMTVRGSSTTVWARHGSVIEINSPGVTLEGLRVEITEGDTAETAITAAFPTEVGNVEVLGTVSGFGEEDGAVEIPRTLSLGELSAHDDNTFLMTVDIPAAAQIVCDQGGVRFVPDKLPAGRSEVRIILSAPGTPGLVYTEILLISRFRRRIYLSGRFTAGAEAVKDRIIYTAERVERSARQQIAQEAPKSVCAPSVPAYNGGAAAVPESGAAAMSSPLIMRKGQRMPLAEYVGGSFTVNLTGVKLGNVDIDPYVFQLDENEKSVGDSGFVFFGNAQSPDGAVTYSAEDGTIGVELGRLPQNVRRIIVAYSVYSGDLRRNFSLVRNPVVSLCVQGEERISFPMEGLTDEITIVAVEMYIYKGEWRISAVGSGYRDGLVKLCGRYGIEVCN